MGHGSRVVSLLGVFLWALLVAVLAGCGGSSPGADVPDSTMVAALSDLHLLDARRELYGDAQLDTDSLRQALLATHGLDTAALRVALTTYASDAPRLRAVYDSVIVRVNAAHRDVAQVIDE